MCIYQKECIGGKGDSATRKRKNLLTKFDSLGVQNKNGPTKKGPRCCERKTVKQEKFCPVGQDPALEKKVLRKDFAKHAGR